jgi:hypothetical protein
VGGTAAGHVDAGWQMSGGKMIKGKGKDQRKIKNTNRWAYCGIFCFTVSV